MEIFLLIIVIVWLIFATISDIKTKEIADWLNFSLMIIAIMTYSLISLKTATINPLLYSIATLIVFFVIGTAMYYAKQWGGGDTKLLAALGASFPVYPTILKNIFTPKLEPAVFPAIILLNIIMVGSIYGMLMITIKSIQNRKKFSEEFRKLIIKSKTLRKTVFLTSIIIIILSYFMLENNQIKTLMIALAIIAPIIFYLFITTKAAEASSMFKKIPTSKLREGDWISEEVTIDKKLIYKPKASGVNKEQIEIIKKHMKEIEIKEGIFFMPTFFIALIISLILGNPILWLF